LKPEGSEESKEMSAPIKEESTPVEAEGRIAGLGLVDTPAGQMTGHAGVTAT
jgi:hypothetical protein